MGTHRRYGLSPAVMILAGAGWLLAACGNGGDDNGDDSTPTPTDETAEPWQGAEVTFDGENASNDLAHCEGSSVDFPQWSGMAVVTRDSGGTINVGDPSDTTNNIVYAECENTDGNCLASGETAERCLLFFLNAGTSPEGNLAYHYFVIDVRDATAQWQTTNPIVLGTPSQSNSPPFAFGRVLIDNNSTDEIEFDSDGNVVPPDTETFTGVTADGGNSSEVSLSAAGVEDGEAVGIDGQSSISLVAPPSGVAPGAGGDVVSDARADRVLRRMIEALEARR